MTQAASLLMSYVSWSWITIDVQAPIKMTVNFANLYSATGLESRSCILEHKRPIYAS